MKNIKSQFVFNRSQQIGIFLLVSIIVVLQLVYLFADFSAESPQPALTDEELANFQKSLDSLKALATEEAVKISYPFNPNFITDYKGYTLGMSIEEIDRLHAFRAQEKWVNSSEDFQKVTGVSDSLLREIAPLFRFPEWVKASGSNTPAIKVTMVSRNSSELRDLNSATAEDLVEVKGIGDVLASRIVNYRNRIGGFIHDIQLKDIYGLNYEGREAVLAVFTVKSKPDVELLDINTASVLELAKIPYFNYELAREIVNYRLLNEKIGSFEELAKIKEFPSEKIDRIALYLYLK